MISNSLLLAPPFNFPVSLFVVFMEQMSLLVVPFHPCGSSLSFLTVPFLSLWFLPFLPCSSLSPCGSFSSLWFPLSPFPSLWFPFSPCLLLPFPPCGSLSQHGSSLALISWLLRRCPQLADRGSPVSFYPKKFQGFRIPPLKVHKRENFLGSDFEICTFS